MECWVRSRSNVCFDTAGREGVFLHRTIRWNETGFSYRPDPKHVDAMVETLSLEDARLVATPYTLTLERAKQTLCAS